MLTGPVLPRAAAACGPVPQLQAAKLHVGLAEADDMDTWGLDCCVQGGSALVSAGRCIALRGRWQHSPTADRS